MALMVTPLGSWLYSTGAVTPTDRPYRSAGVLSAPSDRRGGLSARQPNTGGISICSARHTLQKTQPETIQQCPILAGGATHHVLDTGRHDKAGYYTVSFCQI